MPTHHAKITLSLLFLFFAATIMMASDNSSNITYTKYDSLKVVRLLMKGARQPKGTNLILYYGKSLEGVPYVAHTLEVNKTEKLVVNMKQMDCTTFVETVIALTQTTKQGSQKWTDFTKWLSTIRYRNSRPEGYTSRNHYFIWWVDSNQRKNIITTMLDNRGIKARFTPSIQNIKIDYMTTHSSAYKMLKGNRRDIQTIAKLENETTGRKMKYIPASALGMSKQDMGYVEDGDILAICTKKKGLDTTHIGIAVWMDDGKLHLLNASQIHKKVILEPMTLKEYMAKHPTQLGVWVLRVNNVCL
jgi:hypothetical protein